MTSVEKNPRVILVPGHWLGAWAWDEVQHHLTSTRSRATALTLPGLDEHDPQRASRTLEDQVAAIVDVVGQTRGSGREPAVLVAHSGANAPVSLVIDRHHELVRRVIWIDSGPVATGSVFMRDAPEDARDLPLPAFEELAQDASLAGLSEEALERFRARAVPEPDAVLRAPIELNNDSRRNVPTTLVCCSLPSAHVLELARAGHPMFAEVAHLKDLEVVDLPTGHWPMWSRPADLAAVIEAAVLRGD